MPSCSFAGRACVLLCLLLCTLGSIGCEASATLDARAARAYDGAVSEEYLAITRVSPLAHELLADCEVLARTVHAADPAAIAVWEERVRELRAALPARDLAAVQRRERNVAAFRAWIASIEVPR